MVFNNAGASSYGGNISGGGSVVKSNAGILTLSGSNTYQGGTAVSGGVLALGSSSAVSASGALTLSGGTLDLSGNSQQVAGLADGGSRTGAVANSGGSGVNFTLNQAANATFGGTIGGTGLALVKQGGGMLTLTNANTYTGGTIISSGALRLGDGAANNGSIAGSIADNASLIFANATGQTFNNAISGSGTVTVNPAAGQVLALGGTNTYSGGTSLTSGILSLASAQTAAGGPLGGTGGVASVPTVSFNGGTLQFTAANASDYSGQFSAASNQAYNIDTNGQPVTFSSGLNSNGGSLTKIGAGTLTLGAAGTYTGGTVINGGILAITADNALGTAPASPATNITINGATLQFAANNITLSANRTVQVGSSGGTLDTEGNSITFNGLFSGPGGLTKVGSGTLTDTYPNPPVNISTFAGGLTISGGTMTFIGTNGTLPGDTVTSGSISAGPFGTGTLTINDGAYLLLSDYGGRTFHNSVNLSGHVTTDPTTSATFSSSGLSTPSVVTLQADTRMTMLVVPNINYSNLILSEPIQGAHSLTVDSPTAGGTNTAQNAVLTLGSSTSNYSGGTVLSTNGWVAVGGGINSVVSSGTLVSGPLGTGLVTVHASATLQGIDNNPTTETIANSILIDGNATIMSGHSMFILDSQGTGATVTFANTPTITNITNYGNLPIRNYLLQGSGFNLLGTGSTAPTNQFWVYSPNTSQPGMNTSVTVGSMATLNYDVGTLATAGSFAFGQQAINVVNGGVFLFSAAGQTATLTNAINVPASGGGLQSSAATAVFGGQVNLSGPLTLNNAYLSGPMIVNQSAPAVLSIVSPQNTALGYLNGVISDGAGSYKNPVFFKPFNATCNVTAVNTYSGGTVIDSCAQDTGQGSEGRVVVSSTASLGSGNLTVLPGGKIALLGGLNNLGSGAFVYSSNSSTEAATVAFGASTFTTVAARLSGNDTGILGLEGTHSEAVNLAAVGNGTMFLGAVDQNSTITGSVSPGAGNIYRLGGGGHDSDFGMWTLIMNTNLADFSGTAVQVGQSKYNGEGDVYLNGNNSFTGALDVYTAKWFRDSNAGYGQTTYLRGTQQAAGSPFGAASGNVNLHGSAIAYYAATGAGAITAVTKNTLNFESQDVVSINAQTATPLTPASWNFSNIQRQNNGVLVLDSERNSLGVNEQFLTAQIGGAAPAASIVNGMLSPYLLVSGGAFAPGTVAVAPSFAAYGSNGFVAATYTSTNLAVSGTADIVNYAGGAISGTANAWALNVSGSISGAGTINLGSGGLIINGASPNITANLNFGAAEGVVFLNNTTYPGSTVFSGIISGSNGITIAGTQMLQLTNTGNTFNGQITVNNSSLFAVLDTSAVSTAGSSLGGATNIYLNGGELANNSNNCLAASRTITVGAGGGKLYGGTINVYSPIVGSAGSGPLTLNGSLTFYSSGNTYTGGTRLLAASTLAVAASSSLGTGDVDVSQNSTLTLNGDSNLGAAATLNTQLASTVNFTSGNPVVASLTGPGSVVLGASGATTRLTVGDTVDNFSGQFYGGIGQATGGTGSLSKQGSGTLTLSGPNTYTGPTTVNGGVLNLTGSLASSTVTVNAATLTGNGSAAGSVNVTSSGTLAPLNGVLSVGSLTAASTAATLTFAPGSGSASSQIAVNGAVNVLAGTPIYVNPQWPGFGASSVYNLITYASETSATPFVLANNTAGTSISAGTVSATGYYYRDYDVALIDNGTSALQLSADLGPGGRSQPMGPDDRRHVDADKQLDPRLHAGRRRHGPLRRQPGRVRYDRFRRSEPHRGSRRVQQCGGQLYPGYE